VVSYIWNLNGSQMDVFTTVLIFAIGIFLLLSFCFTILIEPLYVLVFKKPIFIHWYPVKKKLNHTQREIVEREFSFYRKLSSKKKIYFEHRVKAFLQTYKFVGNGMPITDDVKVMIAATYVMLTFGMRNYLIRFFNRIIVYPEAYYSSETQQWHKGEFNPKLKTIVFSWKDFVSGHAANDNINLGLHEFSHALYFHGMKGRDSSAVIFYDEFREVIQYYTDASLYSQLIETSYFRDYAYENQFEFLAVLFEHFFETPHIFKAKHPELFDHIRRMINFDESLMR
jgi:Mlc titration factor MtfA (ptsG expression regulator)